MRHANNFGIGRLATSLAVTAFVLAGPASALAGEAEPQHVQQKVASPQGPCAAYIAKYPDSRTRALLECQNEATPKVTPHLTAEEASKIYDAYLAKLSEERNDVPDKRE